MSNSQVGPVYQQIISDVIESSRVDFEEGGVEEGVLEELKQVCASFSCTDAFMSVVLRTFWSISARSSRRHTSVACLLALVSQVSWL